MSKLLYVLMLIGILVVTVGAWLQHVITCLTNEQWGFLIAGAVLAPIGIIHGWLIWLGVM